MNRIEFNLVARGHPDPTSHSGAESPGIVAMGGMLDSLPIGIYVCDPAGRITYFSRHAEKLWGRTPKLNSDEDKFSGAFKMYSPGGRPLPHDKCSMADALATGEERVGREIVFERPDGGRVHCQTYASPVWNESGQLVGALNLLIETSPRRLTEPVYYGIPDAISPATGQEFLQALVDHLCRDCKVDYAFIAILEPSDPARISTMVVSHKGQRAENFSYPLQGSACAEVLSGELRYFSTDVQHRFPGETTLRRLGITSYMGVPLSGVGDAPPGLLALLNSGPFENPAKAEASIRAVAARAAAELDRETAVRALRESESRLSALVTNSPGISLQWYDAAGRVVLWNPASEEMFGYKADEAIGKTLDQLIFTPEEEAVFRERLASVAREGKTFGPDEYPFRRSNGDTGVCLSTIFRIPGLHGGDYFVCMDVDITGRKRFEDALRESEAQLLELTRSLEQRVSERTRELEEKNRRLRWLAAELTSVEQRERKRMAAILHDDLQQLLVASRMQMSQARDLLNEEAPTRPVEKSRELLDLAIARARDLTLQLRPPALYEDGLLAALRWLGDSMLERHGIRVITDSPQAEPVLADDLKAFLFECVRELLFNAAKHAGVDELLVQARELDGHFRLAVIDQGAGFDPAAAAKQSSGYGLFSIRERIAALGGSMTIESNPGCGTRIDLELPLQTVTCAPPEEEGAVIQAAAPGEREGVADHRIRVLVVDDHAIVREGITNVLGGDERLLVVGEAADGVSAIEAVENCHPQVVLMDVNMPRMNGIEATREISRRWPHTIIVGLSIQDDEATSNSMMNAGAKGFATKAGDSERLIDLIGRLTRHGSGDPTGAATSQIHN